MSSTTTTATWYHRVLPLLLLLSLVSIIAVNIAGTYIIGDVSRGRSPTPSIIGESIYIVKYTSKDGLLNGTQREYHRYMNSICITSHMGQKSSISCHSYFNHQLESLSIADGSRIAVVVPALKTTAAFALSVISVVCVVLGFCHTICALEKKVWATRTRARIIAFTMIGLGACCSTVASTYITIAAAVLSSHVLAIRYPGDGSNLTGSVIEDIELGAPFIFLSWVGAVALLLATIFVLWGWKQSLKKEACEKGDEEMRTELQTGTDGTDAMLPQYHEHDGLPGYTQT